VKIEKFTKKGYIVWDGYKLGIKPEIKFSEVICHVSNIKKLKSVLQENGWYE